MRKEGVSEACRQRWACKKFDGRPIPRAVLLELLECARLAPSSFGLEPWHFAVMENPEAIRRLGDACNAQEAVYTVGAGIVIMVRSVRHYAPDSDFINQRASRFPGGLDAFIPDYAPYHAFLTQSGRLEGWARAQSYIACAHIMLAAAAAGIDSCAIEGFKDEDLLAVTGLSAEDWMPGIVTVLGYAAMPRNARIREPLAGLVSFY